MHFRLNDIFNIHILSQGWPVFIVPPPPFSLWIVIGVCDQTWAKLDVTLLNTQLLTALKNVYLLFLTSPFTTHRQFWNIFCLTLLLLSCLVIVSLFWFCDWVTAQGKKKERRITFRLQSFLNTLLPLFAEIFLSFFGWQVLLILQKPVLISLPNY